MRRVGLLALSSALVLLSGCGSGASALRSGPPRVLTSAPARAPAPRLDPRPFLHAFLRYEVGDAGRRVRGELRRTATEGFTSELLTAAPRDSKTTSPARVARLHITYLTRNPPRALVSGTAMRAGHPEPFAFLFEARHGRWLAAGPAE